ncbi:putative reverse transcriptase domain-containing protein [Tanacetum coccineum]
MSCCTRRSVPWPKAEVSAGGTMEIVVDPLVTGGISKSTRGDAPDLKGTLHDIVHYMSEVPLDRITEGSFTRFVRIVMMFGGDLGDWSRLLRDVWDSALSLVVPCQNGSDDDNRNGGNRDGGNNGNGNPDENGRGAMPVARVCTYQDFVKCQPLNFKGTEGVFDSALTWWNSHKRTIGVDAAFAMAWRDLMELMTKVYCPRNEIQKMETELWNLTMKNNDLLLILRDFKS